MRLATILARAGSKRLPGKNTKPLHGIPLWAHTASQAAQSDRFDLIVVSSDDPALRGWHVMNGSYKAGAGSGDFLSIKRPPELATDECGKVPAIRHALLSAERLTTMTFDTIVDLDVTAPLRTVEDIQGFCAELDKIERGNLVSVTKARKNPWFNVVERNQWNGMIQLIRDGRILRSQDVPLCWELNASMYGWTRRELLEGNDHVIGAMTEIYEMPRERSFDIDDAVDWQIVEMLMEKQKEMAA